MAKKEKNTRIKVLSIILAVILCFYAVRLANWQLFNNDKYSSEVKYTTATYTPIKASRGEILDRYGRPLAQNSDGYNIIFDASYFDYDRSNEMILKLCTLLSTTGEVWRDDIPLTNSEPYEYTDHSNISKEVMFDEIGLNSYATASNCFDVMVEKYELQNYSRQDQRTLMGVRLTMDVSDFAPSIPFTFAENVSIATVTKIKEASNSLPGITCEIASNREYVSGVYATHLIGSIGPIYAEEWDEAQEKGYSYNDKIGKSGIEEYCEDYLRGQNGTRRVLKDSSGSVVSEDISQQPISGDTVYLTLDLNLQKTCFEALENTINEIGVYAGSVVVLDVNTGETLAAVTYPSYDIDSVKTDYETILNDNGKPLFNRALNGTYAPGSTFKPVVAATGLQTGNITSDETIFCSQVYRYFEDYQPSCLGYHGAVNVTSALTVSCNYFFFELGRRIGITTLNKYCKQFGLGVSTGFELNESTGVLAGIESREEMGTVWNEGDTIQAAIGQSDNLFTPLQMATYISTLVNGGSRYRTHLIKDIKNSDLTKTQFETKKEILNKIDIEDKNTRVVKEGMLGVTTEGTASVFSSYPIKVGGKTGTATVYENGIEYDNGIFVSFAPYENPEIAVIVLVEKGGHGSDVAPVAQDIYDAYFYYKNAVYNNDSVNDLLQ